MAKFERRLPMSAVSVEPIRIEHARAHRDPVVGRLVDRVSVEAEPVQAAERREVRDVVKDLELVPVQPQRLNPGRARRKKQGNREARAI
eukprot:6214791-Pleurochrysis_carterae.AAC.11